MKTTQTVEVNSLKAVEGVNKTNGADNIIQKVMDDKKAVNQFFRGEISIDEIDARGIRFVKPI